MISRSSHPGNEDLKKETGARVVAPKADSHRIPGIDEGLSGGDVWMFGDLEMSCIETPGHTSHSLCFWFRSENALFTGLQSVLSNCIYSPPPLPHALTTGAL